MMFKKSDSAEIQRTMTFWICLVIVGIPLATFIQKWTPIGKNIPSSRLNIAELVVVVSAGALLVFNIMYLMKKENRYLCLLDVLVLAYLLSSIISTLFALNVETALSGNWFCGEGITVIVSYLVIMYSVFQISKSGLRKIILVFLTVFGIFEGLFAIMQAGFRIEYFWGVSLEVAADYSFTAMGTLYNQNPFGQLMCMLSCLEMGLFFCSKGNKRVIHGVLLFLYVWCLMASGTRGAIVGLGFAAVLMSFYLLAIHHKDKAQLKQTARDIVLCMVICFAAIALLFATRYSIFQDIMGRTGSDISAVNSDSSVDVGHGRMGIWVAGIKKFFYPHPVIGSGISSFYLERISESNGIFSYTQVYTAHNHYIELLCDQGIIGLLTYMLMIGYILKLAFASFRKSGVKNDYERLGAVIGVIAFMCADVFEFHIIFLTVYFFILLGMCCKREESVKLISK